MEGRKGFRRHKICRKTVSFSWGYILGLHVYVNVAITVTWTWTKSDVPKTGSSVSEILSTERTIRKGREGGRDVVCEYI